MGKNTARQYNDADLALLDYLAGGEMTAADVAGAYGVQEDDRFFGALADAEEDYTAAIDIEDVTERDVLTDGLVSRFVKEILGD